MPSGSSMPSVARSRSRVSGEMLGLSASSANGSPGARLTIMKMTKLIPISVGIEISSRRTMNFAIARSRRGPAVGSRQSGVGEDRSPTPDSRLPTAVRLALVPVRQPPQVGVPGGQVEALETLLCRAHVFALHELAGDHVLHDHLVHLL